MTESGDSRPPLTPRMRRGLEIAARDDEIGSLLADFNRERSRVFRETGVRQSGKESKVSPEERAIIRERRELAAERQFLLDQIAAEWAVLKPKQARFDQARAEAKAARRPKPPVSKAEQRVRDRMAALQRDRAYVDGTAYRDRQQARLDEAVWLTTHDPETFNSDDW
ncbi:hypothetical protein [Herbidospora yilanensis]|uniref:hypothetical protein n=1 Tax=Herbidospora yilanensis TaxID=354426 RepID=UPI000A496C57|nr:hypothetical protein [Herbidospora yilanensis]